jgi:uncharacterized membrane protein YfcA
MNGTTVYVMILVVFVATLIRSALGFGEALFTVPLLALLLPLKVTVPLAGLLSITIAGVIVIRTVPEFAEDFSTRIGKLSGIR